MKTAENGGLWPLLNRSDAGGENDALRNKKAFGRKFIRRGMAWRVMTVTRIYAYGANSEERLASAPFLLAAGFSGISTVLGQSNGRPQRPDEPYNLAPFKCLVITLIEWNMRRERQAQLLP